MPTGVRFVDVLDDALGAIAWDAPTPEEPTRRTDSPRPISYTPLYNLHTPARGAGFEVQALNRDSGEPSRPPVIPEVYTAASRSARLEQVVRTPVSSPAPQRRSRRLTTTQLRSLEAFNRLGAGVRADFSAAELRSAFRMLARSYHPDRHPRASVSDRQRFAQQFTAIRANYETLLTALDAPAA